MGAKDEYSRLTDEELAVRAEDRACFAELHGRYHLRLVGLLKTWSYSVGEADDLAQETWKRAWPTLRDGTFAGRFRDWLFRIARNAAVDWRRKKKTSSLTDELARSIPASCDIPHGDDVEEHLDHFRGCFKNLSDRHSQIVRLRMEGLAPREIATEIDLPAERVHRLYFDAMQLLRECMGVKSK